MENDVRIETVAAQHVAAVRLRVTQPEIAQACYGALDTVWEFLRRHEGLRTDGHNIFVYHYKDDDPGDGKMTVDFGVQVTRSFTGEGDVVCVAMPAGRAVTTLHRGPYQKLIEAHRRVQAFCKANGHAMAGLEWELYGDWNDDQSKLETLIAYMVK